VKVKDSVVFFFKIFYKDDTIHSVALRDNKVVDKTGASRKLVLVAGAALHLQTTSFLTHFNSFLPSFSSSSSSFD